MKLTPSFKEARKKLKKVGTSKASGDALAAMYAELIGFQNGGNPAIFFEHLKSLPTDQHIIERSHRLMRDREEAWDVLMGNV